MTVVEANDLATRIVRTWHGGPAHETWVEELSDLDAGTAGATLVRLRRELERAPSVARYLAVYRSLRTAHNDPIQTKHCTICDDIGWVDAADLIIGEGDRAHHYTQVKPCICDAAVQARRVHAAIIAHANRWPATPPADTRPALVVAPPLLEDF